MSKASDLDVRWSERLVLELPPDAEEEEVGRSTCCLLACTLPYNMIRSKCKEVPQSSDCCICWAGLLILRISRIV